ncbi:MAG: hypothetical protein WCF65_08615 [Parachlamydiaceae bacterium]
MTTPTALKPNNGIPAAASSDMVASKDAPINGFTILQDTNGIIVGAEKRLIDKDGCIYKATVVFGSSCTKAQVEAKLNNYSSTMDEKVHAAVHHVFQNANVNKIVCSLTTKGLKIVEHFKKEVAGQKNATIDGIDEHFQKDKTDLENITNDAQKPQSEIATAQKKLLDIAEKITHLQVIESWLRGGGTANSDVIENVQLQPAGGPARRLGRSTSAHPLGRNAQRSKGAATVNQLNNQDGSPNQVSKGGAGSYLYIDENAPPPSPDKQNDAGGMSGAPVDQFSTTVPNNTQPPHADHITTNDQQVRRPIPGEGDVNTIYEEEETSSELINAETVESLMHAIKLQKSKIGALMRSLKITDDELTRQITALDEGRKAQEGVFQALTKPNQKDWNQLAQAIEAQKLVQETFLNKLMAQKNNISNKKK